MTAETIRTRMKVIAKLNNGLVCYTCHGIPKTVQDRNSDGIVTIQVVMPEYRWISERGPCQHCGKLAHKVK